MQKGCKSSHPCDDYALTAHDMHAIIHIKSVAFAHNSLCRIPAERGISMKRFSRIMQAVLTAAVLTLCCLVPQFGNVFTFGAAAVSADYPPQLMNIASKDHGSVLTESGTADGAAVTMKPLGGDLGGMLSHEAVGHTVEADLVAGGSVAGP